MIVLDILLGILAFGVTYWLESLSLPKVPELVRVVLAIIVGVLVFMCQ
jgi:hypothetical protein